MGIGYSNAVFLALKTYLSGLSIKFIVDTVRDIQDPRQLEAELTGLQTVDGRQIDIRVIVCEP